MPLNSRGSVSDRFTVWLSERRRSANASSVGVEHLESAARELGEAASPRTRWSDARRLVPASVSVSVPVGNSNAARSARRAGLVASRLPVKTARDHEMEDDEQIVVHADDDALAEPAHRANASCPTSSSSGGSTVRRRNGVLSRTLEIGWPTSRVSSASTYATMSGELGHLSGS